MEIEDFSWKSIVLRAGRNDRLR